MTLRERAEKAEADAFKAETDAAFYLQKAQDNDARVRSVEKKLEESESSVAKLKKRLLDSEAERLQQRGYLKRVAEDDVARDGFVEVRDENGQKVMKPKRPYPEGNEIDFDDIMGGNPSVHWTSY